MSSSVFVCGDIHGTEAELAKILPEQFPEGSSLTKDDIVIQLGDFGIPWFPDGVNRTQDTIVNTISKLPFTIAVVPGNHENYTLISDLPVSTRWGAPVRIYRDNIVFLSRGYVYDMCGLSIFACGGATSIDKAMRLPGVSWWEEECLSFQEEENAISQLKNRGFCVDYIVTHTAPNSVIKEVLGENLYKCSVASFLEFVKDNTFFKKWHFGHLHEDVVVEGGKFQCHYMNAPKKIKE